MRLRLFTKAFAQICFANFSYTQTLQENNLQNKVEIFEENENLNIQKDFDVNIPINGEKCEYDDYPATCIIVKVEELKNLSPTTEPSYRPHYEVLYRIIPDDKNMVDAIGMTLLNKDIRFTLGSSSWNVGPKYIEKYDLKVNNVYKCFYRKIKQGTCTPGIINIEGLDEYDYFELN